MLSFAKTLARRSLGKAGYWVVARKVLPFGIDYLWDIERLAARHSITIRTAFDVGAHDGSTAKDFLRTFPDAEIHSFEPHPHSFYFLNQLQSDRLHKHQIALSDASGPADFFVFSKPTTEAPDGPASMSNSLVAQQGRHSTSIKVERATVDEFCLNARIKSVDLLKIDTEGHDSAVVAGAKQTLRSTRFVFCEFNSLAPGSHGSLVQIAQTTEPIGFRLVATYPVHIADAPFSVTSNALFFRTT